MLSAEIWEHINVLWSFWGTVWKGNPAKLCPPIGEPRISTTGHGLLSPWVRNFLYRGQVFFFVKKKKMAPTLRVCADLFTFTLKALPWPRFVSVCICSGWQVGKPGSLGDRDLGAGSLIIRQWTARVLSSKYHNHIHSHLFSRPSHGRIVETYKQRS